MAVLSTARVQDTSCHGVRVISPSVAGPTADSVLRVLTRPRLMEVARELGVVIPASGRKDSQIAKLPEGTRLPMPAWLGYLVRDELRSACRDQGLDAASRSRAELAGVLLDAAGLPRGQGPIPPMFASAVVRDLHRRGDIRAVRHRQYLVEAVHRGASDQDTTRGRLVGLDDDNQGRRAEVVWELELGAHVVEQGATLLGEVARLDPPRTFGAYYNAVRWNRVTATDARLFQAPFRAGVKVMCSAGLKQIYAYAAEILTCRISSGCKLKVDRSGGSEMRTSRAAGRRRMRRMKASFRQLRDRSTESQSR